MNKKYLVLCGFLLIITMNNFAMLAKAKQWFSKQNWYQPTRQSSTMVKLPNKPTDTTTVKNGYDSFLSAFSSTLKRLIMPKQYTPRTRLPKITYEAEAQNRLRELDELQQNPSDTSWSAWFGLGQDKKAISRGAAQTKERLQTSIDQAGNNPLVQKRLVELSKYEQPAITELEDIKTMSDPNEGAKGQLVVRMPDPRYIASEQTIVKDTENARKRLITDAQMLDQSPVLLNEAITLNKKWLETKKLYNAAVLTNNETAQSTLEKRLSDIDARRELLLKHAPVQIKK